MLTTGVFSKQLSVSSYMVDSHTRLTPVSLLGELQEIAAAHCSVFHLSGIDLKPRGYFWILSRMHLQFESYPQWGDHISLETWEKPHGAISQPRDFLVKDSNGNIIARASSVWAIIDAQSKPQKLEHFDCEEGVPIEDNALTTRAFHRCPPAPIPTQPQIRQVLHSDIDLNEHVNNTRYVQWAFDALGHDFCKQHHFQEISIHFISQLFPQDDYFAAHQFLDERSLVCSIYAADDQREVCRIWISLSSSECE